MLNDHTRQARRREVTRGVASLIGLVLALLVGQGLFRPDAAAAHSATNTPSSNYVTSVVSLKATSGDANIGSFSLRSIEAGSRLELTWLSGPEVQIPDYDGHPYLRVGPQGAYENTQSNATYLNADRNGATPIPEGTNPDGPPIWRKLSSGTTVRWHDHRAHRMGGDPPEVKANPGKRQVVQEEPVELRQGDTTWTALIRVTWVPGPSPVVAYAITALGVLALLVGGVLSLRNRARARRVGAAVAALLAVLIVVDAVHLVGIAFGVAGSTGAAIARMFSVGFASLAAWAIGIVGVAMLLRRRVDGFYLAAFAAGLMTLVGGLADVSALRHSSIPFAYSAGIARTCVVLTLVLGVSIAMISVLATRPGLADAVDEA